MIALWLGIQFRQFWLKQLCPSETLAYIHASPVLVWFSCRIFIFWMKGNIVGHPVGKILLDNGFE